MNPLRFPRRPLCFVGLAALLSVDCAWAQNDAYCFPVYQRNGARPGTENCVWDAATGPFGMGDYVCGGSPESIENYCGPKESECAVGNPIYGSTGNKHQIERDYTGTGAFPLEVERYYNSAHAREQGRDFGKLWRWTYSRSVTLSASPAVAYSSRPDGSIVYFESREAKWTPDADSRHQLVQLRDEAGKTNGWQFTNGDDDSIELFDAQGRLSKITTRSGQSHTLTRSTHSTPSDIAPGPNYLIRVTDHFGRQLLFTWNRDGNLATFSDPQGNIYRYAYDSDKRLISVTYPAEGDGQPKRTFVYNEREHTQGADLPNLLTGIIDENNARLATFDYDANGRGVGTQHAGGANKYTLAYGNKQTVVTDPLGSSRTYRFTKILTVLKLAGVDQPGGSGCAAASNNLRYDTNGNVIARTDFNGVLTTYTYHLARNLETSRTEASGTPQARTISTIWHPSYRLPLKTVEPKRLTTYSYFPNGMLQAKTVQAINDETGTQGFNAPVTGTPRVWSYTYNGAGQILTATGPRSDVSGKTTYTYDDTAGNLTTITDAVGHVTRLSNYDAHGRVGTVVEPNGVTISFTYHPRGWLTSRTESAVGLVRATRYEYDNAGLLRKVTLPDASVINYGYDAAQRLTEVADNVGNRIRYVLDSMGNRIEETVIDATGNLTRRTTRIYDELNRVKSATGGAQ